MNLFGLSYLLDIFYELFSFYNLIFMFQIPSLIQKIIDIADHQMEFQNIWQIKTIRFDLDPDEEKKKFQKYLHVSYHVQDIKGNPGMRGHFFLTNLRVIWQAANDRYTNLSFGIDTMVLVNIKTLPMNGGAGSKHLMIVKCENLNQTRYEFKFIGFSETELKLFNQISDIHKKAVQTKSFRSVNLSLKCDPEFVPIQQQQVKSTYNNCIFHEDHEKNNCKILLTNIRLIIIRNQPKTLNYAIPWIMIKSFQLTEEQEMHVIFLCIRGHLNRKKLLIRAKNAAQLKKMNFEFKSFGQTFNKSPIFGLDTSEMKEVQTLPPRYQQDEIEEIVETKINLKKKKNAYSTEQSKGNLQSTYYNEQLGLMMEKLPEGVTRADLWQLLRD